MVTDGGSDIRVLLNGKLMDRQRSGEHDDDGNDPGKDGPVDEETSHRS